MTDLDIKATNVLTWVREAMGERFEGNVQDWSMICVGWMIGRGYTVSEALFIGGYIAGNIAKELTEPR